MRQEVRRPPGIQKKTAAHVEVRKDESAKGGERHPEDHRAANPGEPSVQPATVLTTNGRQLEDRHAAKSSGFRAPAESAGVGSKRDSPALSREWLYGRAVKEIRLNAFEMNCVGHQSPGLWAHPRDR